MCDDGIATQSILLGAVEAGYGGCIIRAVNRKKLREILNLPEQFEIIQVIALGKPKEAIILDEMTNGEIKYWRDANQVHHVPKRSLEEIILRTV
jgi:nitroreductase